MDFTKYLKGIAGSVLFTMTIRKIVSYLFEENITKKINRTIHVSMALKLVCFLLYKPCHLVMRRSIMWVW